MRLSRASFITISPAILRHSLSWAPAVASRPSTPVARRAVRSPAAVRPRAAATVMATANGHPAAAGGAAAASTPSPASTSTPTPTATPATATAPGGGALPPRAYGPRPTLVLTNDDGVDPLPPATLLLPLARAVAAAAPAYDVLVVAPAANQSACGMRISLGTPLTLTRRQDLEVDTAAAAAAAAPAEDGDTPPPAPHADLHDSDTAATAAQQAQAPGSFTVYTLSGSPADAVITAIEPFDGLVARRGGVPVLVVSGVNVGPNLGTDVLYSGTFSAARQGGLYGVPAVALSLCGGDGGGAAAAAAAALVVRLLAVVRAGDAAAAAAATAAAAAAAGGNGGGVDAGGGGGGGGDGGAANPGRLDARHWHAVADGAGVRRAFCRGDLTLNVNVPAGWAGGWATCTLGALFYRGVVGLPPSYTPGTGAAEAAGVRVKLGGGRIEKMVLAAAAAGGGGEGAPASTAAAVRRSGDADADATATAAAAAAAAAAASRHAAAHALTDVAGIEAGLATVTAVSTWPAPHEAAVGDAVLGAALVAGADGLPAWLAAEADGRGGAPAADEADAMRLEVTRVAGVHVGGSEEAAP